MAFVIVEPCQGCKDQACVTVCPADCIREGIFTEIGRVYDQLFIDPNECIDCGLCEAECPVDAIFAEDEVPIQWDRYAGINAAFHLQIKHPRVA